MMAHVGADTSLEHGRLVCAGIGDADDAALRVDWAGQYGTPGEEYLIAEAVADGKSIAHEDRLAFDARSQAVWVRRFPARIRNDHPDVLVDQLQCGSDPIQRLCQTGLGIPVEK